MDAQTLALVAAVLAVLSTLIAIILTVRQQRLLARYRALLQGPSGGDLEGLILRHADQIGALQQAEKRLTDRTEGLAKDARLHVQRVGVVRFNAFPDTGSDLSFSIALLDAFDNGVVMSSLYGRSESRIYAKPVQGGKSTYTLTDEEKQAIAKAQSGHREGVSSDK